MGHVNDGYIGNIPSGQGWVKLAESTASDGDTNLDFQSKFTDEYDTYQIVFRDCKPNTDGGRNLFMLYLNKHNLYEKFKPYKGEKQNSILVKINGNNFNQQDFQYIQQFPEILQDSGEIGSFELGNLHINIVHLKTYEKELIICE